MIKIQNGFLFGKALSGWNQSGKCSYKLQKCKAQVRDLRQWVQTNRILVTSHGLEPMRVVIVALDTTQQGIHKKRDKQNSAHPFFILTVIGLHFCNIAGYIFFYTCYYVRNV
jgi:hypothetical protein